MKITVDRLESGEWVLGLSFYRNRQTSSVHVEFLKWDVMFSKDAS